ncbi:hypothetical protein O181_029804 [Austropuccinia psidii MF-1]|uniref:Uncharacterized protein n=1 Tax=Austropuccinia psidii MF-1 TaxID=1389203 RepID=A0A9Q3H4X7_9BASI|nr:hypothetical protein [Austropuccinia psidii MF-1]
MLGTKPEFPTAYHPQKDGLAENKIKNLEDMSRIFCGYGMEYKDHEGYTLELVTLIPVVQLAYKTSVHSVTVNTPAILEKGWNPLLTVDYLKKNLLSVHPTSKDFQVTLKKAFEKAENLIVEAKLYNKQRYYKIHQGPDFKEGDKFLSLTLNVNSLKGPKKMRDFSVGPFNIIRMIGTNAVEVTLSKRFSRKHAVFPVILVEPYDQTDDDKFPKSKKIFTH